MVRTDDPIDVLVMRQPASWWGARWREAIPLGNGRTGAAVFGAVHRETVMLTHAQSWWQDVTPDLPDVSDALPAARKALDNGDAAAAEHMIANALRGRGFAPRVAVPLPIADLSILMPVREGFRQYRRSLNMANGEATVRWTDGVDAFQRSTFVSRANDTVCCDIRSWTSERLDVWVGLDLHDPADARRPFPPYKAKLPEKVEQLTDGQSIFYASEASPSHDVGAVARVLVQGGTVEREGDGLRIGQANRVLILLKVFTTGSRQVQWPRLHGELARIDMGYTQLLAEHRPLHEQLYRSCALDLAADDRDQSVEELLLDAYEGVTPTALLEKLWRFGRYLMISGSDEHGSLPCPLLGIWCGEYDGFWSFNMANVNLQMTYWHVLGGNLSQFLKPVFAYYQSHMEQFRINARRIYGCRGILVPAVTSPTSGLMKDLQPHILHFTAGAGWLCQHFYDYYLHTGDQSFLKGQAIPFMREVAQFYLDFLVLGPDGRYRCYPGNSPENSPIRCSVPGCQISVNATIDIAVARELFTNLIAACTEIGVCGDDIPTWRSVLDRLPPYDVNEDGAAREWMHPGYADNYAHRHQSHLYPLFPGLEISSNPDSPHRDAFATALRMRQKNLSSQTSWSLANMACVLARLNEGDDALNCIDAISRSCLLGNLWTVHNDWRQMGIGLEMEWAPFQIDANMGITNAIQEMLMFSVPGEIRLLPALPSRLRRGHIGPMLSRGGIHVSVQWDQDLAVVRVELRSRTAQAIRVSLPWAIIDYDLPAKAGTAADDRTLSVSLRAGESLNIQFRVAIGEADDGTMPSKGQITEQPVSAA